MLDPSRVSAVIPTRGNVDLAPILDSLIFDDVIVWDNSKETEDAGTYGRYLAMERAKHEIVFAQDDDVIVPPETQRALLNVHRDGLLTTNTEPRRLDEKWTWLGWGSIVHRDLPEQVLEAWGGDTREKWFRLVGCDILVGQNVPAQTICWPHTHLDYAFDEGRVFRSRGYGRAKERYWREAQTLKKRWRLP